MTKTRKRANAPKTDLFGPRRGQEWAYHHEHCRDCGTTRRPHLADGYCVDCWRKRRTPASGSPAPIAPEQVAVLDRDGRVLGGLSIEMTYPTKEELLDAALMEP